MNYNLLNLLIILILVGCGDDSPRVKSVTFDKVESIHKIFHKNEKLPSEILEFNFVQENIVSSGRVPDPTDYTSYLRIKVEMANVEKWVSNLKPPFNNTTKYSSPHTPQAWWLPETEFKNLTLYETKKYFNRYNGWLCIDKLNGYIYAYTFTQ